MSRLKKSLEDIATAVGEDILLGIFRIVDLMQEERKINIIAGDLIMYEGIEYIARKNIRAYPREIPNYIAEGYLLPYTYSYPSSIVAPFYMYPVTVSGMGMNGRFANTGITTKLHSCDLSPEDSQYCIYCGKAI